MVIWPMLISDAVGVGVVSKIKSIIVGLRRAMVVANINIRVLGD